MLEKIKENKKLFILIAVITIVMILIFTMLNKCSKKMVDDVIETNGEKRIEEEAMLSLNSTKDRDLYTIFHNLIENGSNWSNLPVSDSFLNKYSDKEGIITEYSGYYYCDIKNIKKLNDKNIEVKYSLAWFLDPDKDAGKSNFYRLYDITVTFFINDKGEIDDLIKSEPDIIYENGEPNIEYDKTITVDNFEILLLDILFFDAEKNFMWNGTPPKPKNIRKEPCSKKLCDKVLNQDKNVDRIYNDFFSEYNCGGGAIYYPNGTTIEEAFNNKECFISCRVFRDGAEPYYEWEDPEHNYLYKLNFKLDEEGKLDDLKLEFVKEISNEELEANYHF